MKEENITYCVYRHTSPSGKVYIGQTCNIHERWFPSNYIGCKIFYRAILKYGWNNIKHEVLFDNLTKEKVNYLETELIRHYKNLGISYNITDGGEGGHGLIPWNKGKKTGIIPPNKGIPLSQETRDKISKAKKGHKYGPQSTEHIKHKVEIHKVPIIQVDIFDPHWHKLWKSAQDVQDTLGFSRKGISRCLTNNCVQAYGYFWFYYKGFNIGQYYDKYEAYEKAKIHYKHDVMPDWINVNGINIINCLKKKE